MHSISTNKTMTNASKLLDVSNGSLPLDVNCLVDISTIGNYVSSPEELCTAVYPNLSTNYISHEWMCERAILAPTNATAQALNTCLLCQLPTQDLKLGCPIILLRNLEPPQLCNGTHLAVKQMLDNALEATIITGRGIDKSAFIPRVPLIPTDCVFAMKRVQFPIRLSFAMTINKAQVVGLDLNTPCFSHGHLYVECSRVGNLANLFYYTPKRLTKNVVYKAALQ
uniref:DNA helicase Pif1-like 2B domain-containing protein n=1 Tax=Octopus bimaculoides TaxID=37653 RepID=A0A0L8HY08_OCTBM